MKKSIAVALLIALVAPIAFGQGAAAIRRAREISNQNNVRQGVPSPAQNQPVPVAPKSGAAPSNTVTQAQSLTALQGDLAGFKIGTPATAAQKQQFTVDLAKAVRGNKPSLTAVKKFVESLTGALGSATMTEEQQSRLAANMDAALNSRALSPAQFEKIIADTQAILQVGTIKRTAAMSIAADLKAIGMEVRR